MPTPQARLGVVPSLVVSFLLACSAFLTAAPATADDPAGPPPPRGPTRIMFVGDSLTHGRQTDATYRYFVWREFVRQGVPVEFVGPSHDLAKTNGAHSRYLFTDHGFQPDHAARGGTDLPYHLIRLTDRVTTYRPDLIVLMLGFNDTASDTPGEIAANTARYLQKAWKINPALKFILGQITPSRRPKDPQEQRRNATGKAANRLVAAQFATDPRVQIARTRNDPVHSWKPDRHTYDGIHPNMTGQGLMGHLFAAAAQRHGLLPDAPAPPLDLAWKPRPVISNVKVATTRRVRLGWAGQSRSMSATGVRLTLRRADGTIVVVTGYRKREVFAATLKPGRYTGRLTAQRGRMVSMPGPAVTFRVTR